MELLRIEKSKGWPEILRLMPETPPGEPLKIDIAFYGAVTQAISRTLKRTNPEMKFKTKTPIDPNLGVEIIEVTKSIKQSDHEK